MAADTGPSGTSVTSSSSTRLESHEDQSQTREQGPDNLKRLLHAMEMKRSARSIVVPQDGQRTPTSAAATPSQPERPNPHSTQQSDRGGLTKSATSCGHCSALIDPLARTTALERAQRLCHCCKLSLASINRIVVNRNKMLMRLRFCIPCLEENDDEFIELVRAAQPPSRMTCSGCLKIKHRQSFHKRQRIFWHWEEPLGQKYYCSTCLPSGFALEEDRIMPKNLKCAQCDKVRHRNAFTRSLKEQTYSSENLAQFEQCVKDSRVDCNYCLEDGERLDDRMLCSKCDQLLDRSKFSHSQQIVARKEDVDPGHLGFDPAYVCYICWVTAIEDTKRNRYREPVKRHREDLTSRNSSEGHYKR